MTESKLTFREQMKGFPLWQLTVISIVRFAEPIAFTSLFPYVYFMIRDFGIAEQESDIAKYSGYLSGSFAFFQFLFCVRWSQLSDRIGRKKVMLMGSTGLSLSMIMFGFSPNFYTAILSRSVMGALSGNISVIRTVIGETAKERRHQAIAFSTLPLFWNLGSVVGPMIGGSKYLTRPKGNLKAPESFLMKKMTMTISSFVTSNPDSFYERFITKYPYALSNIFVASFLWCSIVICFLFLEETQEKSKHKRDVGIEIGDNIRRFFGYKCPLRPWQQPKELAPRIVSENDPLLEAVVSSEDSVSIDSRSDVGEESVPRQLYDSVGENDTSESIHSIGPLSRRFSNAIVRRYSSTQMVTPVISRTESNIYDSDEPVFTKAVIQTITANFVASFHSIVYSEFLPVFLAGELLPDQIRFPFKIKGGLGWDSSSIGTLLSSTGLIGVFSVMLVFPFIDRHFKTVDGYRVPTLVFPFTYAALPFLIFTSNSYNPNMPPNLTTTLIYTNCCITTFTSAVGFPQVLLLIHRATNPKNRAYINGTALSISALARFIAPMFWGVIVSFTERHSIGGTSWFLLSFLCVLGSIQAFFFLENYEEDMKETQSTHQTV